jgi:hypothetical protein
MRMVTAGIVQKQVNEPLARVHRLDQDEPPDRAGGIDTERFHHHGSAGFQIGGAKDVYALPARGLLADGAPSPDDATAQSGPTGSRNSMPNSCEMKAPTWLALRGK